MPCPISYVTCPTLNITTSYTTSYALCPVSLSIIPYPLARTQCWFCTASVLLYIPDGISPQNTLIVINANLFLEKIPIQPTVGRANPSTIHFVNMLEESAWSMVEVLSISSTFLFRGWQGTSA